MYSYPGFIYAYHGTKLIYIILTEWLIEYKQNRPGLKELQQRIDDFITTYEEQQEQVRVLRSSTASHSIFLYNLELENDRSTLLIHLCISMRLLGKSKV